MIPENRPGTIYWYGSYEGYESRARHRLKNDLEVEEAAVETILRLRGQVVELQSRVRALEAELTALHATRQSRLAQYRAIYYEAAWIEPEIQE